MIRPDTEPPAPNTNASSPVPPVKFSNSLNDCPPTAPLSAPVTLIVWFASGSVRTSASVPAPAPAPPVSDVVTAPPSRLIVSALSPPSTVPETVPALSVIVSCPAPPLMSPETLWPMLKMSSPPRPVSVSMPVKFVATPLLIVPASVPVVVNVSAPVPPRSSSTPPLPSMPVAPVSEPPAEMMNKSAPAEPVRFSKLVNVMPFAVPSSAPVTSALVTLLSVSPAWPLSAIESMFASRDRSTVTAVKYAE